MKKNPACLRTISIVVFTCLVMALSCTDHDVAPRNLRLVKRQSVGYGSYRYTYDAANKLATEVFEPEIMITPFDVAFTVYTPDGRLSEAVENYPAPVNDLGHEVQRDMAGKITRIRKYCVGGPTCTSGIWYFTYPSADVVEVAFWDNGSLYRGKDAYKFNSAGQIAEIKHYNSSDVLATTTDNLTFDDKKNMLGFYPEGYLALPASNNNVVDFRITTHATSDVTDASYVYEYNAEGWVTKRSRTGSRTDILEYEAY